MRKTRKSQVCDHTTIESKTQFNKKEQRKNNYGKQTNHDSKADNMRSVSQREVQIEQASECVLNCRVWLFA